jgi:hypothetical protein
MAKNNDIENDNDDLKGMAPKLLKLSNSNPFKADTDYFENFESRLKQNIDGLDEIKTEAPYLYNIPKYNPFEVPAHYFDEVPTIIQQRCIESKPAISIIDWLLLLIKPRFAVPVLATIFIAISGIHFMEKNADLPKTETAEEISVEEQLYNIDESTIVEALTTEPADLKQNNANENIENYLIDNDIDETNLENEL